MGVCMCMCLCVCVYTRNEENLRYVHQFITTHRARDTNAWNIINIKTNSPKMQYVRKMSKKT